MTKTISSLKEDIYALFSSEAHEPSEENLRSFADNLCALVRRRLSPESTNGGSLRFSNLGKPDRQLWYTVNRPDLAENLSPKTQLKFLYGDVIEELMLLLAKEAGHSVSHEQEQVECDGVLGHIDAIIDGVTVDVKSASPQSFRKFETGALLNGDDPFGYVGQISGYASILTPDTGAAFLAFDKVGGDICVLGVPASKVAEFQPAERIRHLRSVLGATEKPERCYDDVEDGKSGNRKLATNCSYCAFKFDCWPGLRGFAYSNGPRWLTRVAKLPDVPEIRAGSASVTDEDISAF